MSGGKYYPVVCQGSPRFASRTDRTATEILRQVPAETKLCPGVGINSHIPHRAAQVRDEVVSETAAQLRMKQSPFAFAYDFKCRLVFKLIISAICPIAADDIMD